MKRYVVIEFDDADDVHDFLSDLINARDPVLPNHVVRNPDAKPWEKAYSVVYDARVVSPEGYDTP